jgi:hypothetical protein
VSFDPQGFLTALTRLAVARRAAFKRPWRIAFRLQEGPMFLLDLETGELASADDETPADAAMLTNRRTLEDMAKGQLDPNAPRPGQVCLLSGERDAFRDLGRVLAAP